MNASPDIFAGGLPKSPVEWSALLNALKERGFDSKLFLELSAKKKSVEARQLLTKSLPVDLADVEKLAKGLGSYLRVLQLKTQWLVGAASVVPGVAVVRHVWENKKTYATIAALLVGAVAYVGLGGPGVALAQGWLMQKLIEYGLPSGAAAVSAIVSGAQKVAGSAKGFAVSAGAKIAEQLPAVADKMGAAKDAVKEGAGKAADILGDTKGVSEGVSAAAKGVTKSIVEGQQTKEAAEQAAQRAADILKDLERG